MPRLLGLSVWSLVKDEDGDEISSCVAVGDLFRKTATELNQKAKTKRRY